eukprot:5125374-Prymnesium_polylepis.1
MPLAHAVRAPWLLLAIQMSLRAQRLEDLLGRRAHLPRSQQRPIALRQRIQRPRCRCELVRYGQWCDRSHRCRHRWLSCSSCCCCLCTCRRRAPQQRCKSV